MTDGIDSDAAADRRGGDRPGSGSGSGSGQQEYLPPRSTTPILHRRRLLTALSAGSLAGLAGLAGCAELSDDGPEPVDVPRLHVDGRWLVDPDGAPVVLRGVSAVDPVWGTEHESERGRDYWETLRLATDESAGWHARVLRVPVEPRSIDAVGLDAIVEDYLDRAVDLAAERDVYVLLDYHATERYDTPSIDRRLRAFWNRVAPRYADRPHVLYELFNEPTEPAAGGIEAWRTWRERASPWVSLIRDHAPETPVVVGSPSWSSMAAYAAAEPFDHDNLLYSAHVYPSWEPDSWEETFGTPALEVPVFVTEWGYTDAVADDARRSGHALGTTDEWGEPFREWLDAHENVHWCAATFDSLRRPAMFDTDWELQDGDHMGALVKDWLADRRTDHRPGESTPRPSDDGSPPRPPERATVTRVGETSATIEWTAADPDDETILQYRVAVDDRDPAIFRGSRRSTTLSDLEPSERYEVAVTAVDERGLESEPATLQVRTLDRADPEATIPRTTAAPAVDGSIDDVWEKTEPHSADRFFWGVRPQGIPYWRARWDEDALYVLVDVTAADEQEETMVELYLDLDNSSKRNYDETDLQLVVERGDELIQRGTNSAPLAKGLDASVLDTDDGWRTVFTVPWDEYDVHPIVGHRLGMDVHLVLGTDDTERRGKIGWFDETDDAWQDPRRFGAVELGN